MLLISHILMLGKHTPVLSGLASLQYNTVTFQENKPEHALRTNGPPNWYAFNFVILYPFLSELGLVGKKIASKYFIAKIMRGFIPLLS